MHEKGGEWFERRGKVSEPNKLCLDGIERGGKDSEGKGRGAGGLVAKGEGSTLVRLADEGSISSILALSVSTNSPSASPLPSMTQSEDRARG